MKFCNLCNRNLELFSFHRHKNSKDGHSATCKACAIKRVREHRAKNPEIYKQKAKNWRESSQYNQKYRAAHPEYFTTYREKNKAKIQKWFKDNRKKLQAHASKRYQEDLHFRLRSRLSSRLSTLVRRSLTHKFAPTLVLLGCSLADFKKHIENQFQDKMTWANYGQWHLDHIKPCASFDLTKIEDQKECFHFSNFQPLWAVDNIKKNARLDYDKPSTFREAM